VSSTSAVTAYADDSYNPIALPDILIPPFLFSAAAEALHAIGNEDSERAIAVGLLRDIFGNPFRLPAIAPSVLAWNGGTVKCLAEDAYWNRLLPAGHLDHTRLTALANALQLAGCNDEEILDHLRGPGPHVRGCWVLDLVTNLE
jgi:hypothetical protein